MTKLGVEWERYEALMEERAEEFVDSGSIHIVTDPALVEEFERSTGRKIGVVYQSAYHLMVVDLVYEEEGKYFAYERVLPAIKKGAVVIVPQHNGKFVLLRQFRHALRDYQYAFPRGFGETNISAVNNVQKEIQEELSATASNIQYLGCCVADSGLCGNNVAVYSCNIDSFSENIGYEGIANVIELSDVEMLQWIIKGKLTDGYTLSGYSFLTAQRQNRLRSYLVCK